MCTYVKFLKMYANIVVVISGYFIVVSTLNLNFSAVYWLYSEVPQTDISY